MDLTDIIYSEDYASLIVRSYILTSETYQSDIAAWGGSLYVNPQYSILYLKTSFLPENLYSNNPFNTIPKLFTPLNTVSLEASGISQVQSSSGLNLQGKNIAIGFIDTGIDYAHPAFLNSRGRSRILRLWDQTDRSGNAPSLFPYGSEYTNEEIDAALASERPASLVPERDTNGHGTYVAGVAAGSPDTAADFTGAAPESDLLVVKLKPAKQNIRNFYLLPPDAEAYQEDDLLTAIRYLTYTAELLRKSLVICLALGTNQGSHSGALPVSLTLSRLGEVPGIIPVCATGNEGGAAHHFYGFSSEDQTPKDVEILVPEGSRGFTMELWGQAPQLFSVGFRSPIGEQIPRIPVSLNQEQRITFVLERTVIYVNYDLVQTSTGSQLIIMRVIDPTPGIWSLQVYHSINTDRDFHVWLPITGFTDPDITFLEPDPYTTLTTPSTTDAMLSPSTYQAQNNSLSIHSGRGFTRLGGIKPDFAAPGVDVLGPGPNGQYLSRSGSSGAAAITAGAAALMLEWGAGRTPVQAFTAQQMKSYLIRGAIRSPELTYPNRDWGYGRLNLYNTFLSLMTT